MLEEAQAMVKNNPDVDYVFADVNCRLTVKFKSNRYVYFNSIVELKNNLNKNY